MSISEWSPMPREFSHIPVVSIVIPAYNEADCAQELISRLQSVFDSVEGIEFDCIIVENGSVDGTGEIFRIAIGEDARFRLVALSRNYGTDGGISVGLWCANGDACVIMNADLQDPPELIPEFISKWLLGWNNVYGLITNREGVTRSRRVLTGIFYNLIGWASEYPMPRNASDFRIVDRSVYRVAREMPERRRFMRGIFAFIEPRSLGVPHVRPARFAGTSKISISVVGFAYGAILASSKKPLRILSLFGFVIALVAVVLLATLSLQFLTRGVPFDGFGTLIGINLLGFGFLAVFMGVIGEYLSMIFDDSRSRPLFIVDGAASGDLDKSGSLRRLGPGFSERHDDR
jgi:glycosyltransferase involved in cell wall biosynthesis